MKTERRLKRVFIGEDQMIAIISGRAHIHLPPASRICALYPSADFYPLRYTVVIHNPSFEPVEADREVPVTHDVLFEYVEEQPLDPSAPAVSVPL